MIGVIGVGDGTVHAGARLVAWAVAGRAAAADLAPVLPGLVPLGLVVGIAVAGTDLGRCWALAAGLRSSPVWRSSPS